MPELPEITALGAFLTEHAAGDPIAFVQAAAMGLLATVQPPIGALVGGTITAVGRHGKFLDITVSGGATPEPLHLVLHLARAGWLRWSDAMSTAMIKLGGPIALRVRLDVRLGLRRDRGGHEEVGDRLGGRGPADGPRRGPARAGRTGDHLRRVRRAGRRRPARS